MSTETEHYGLSLTPVETDKMFLDWRQEIDGETDSNMTKIDSALFNKANRSVLAEDYDNSRVYQTGQYAYFDGVLKKYNGTEWVIASIGDDLAADADSLGKLSNAIINDGWNQLADVSTATGTTSGITWSNDGKSVTATGTATTNAYRMLYSSTVVGHKYALIGGNQHIRLWHNGTPNNYDRADKILSVTESGNIYARVSTLVTVSGETITPRVHDLTEIFGAGNEPTLEQFKQLFPDDYYPYTMPGFGDLLWENSSPTAAFATQTITLDLSRYTAVAIQFGTGGEMRIVKKTLNTAELSGGGQFNFIRQFTVMDSRVVVGEGAKYDAYGSGLPTSYNTALIPVAIYGIR